MENILKLGGKEFKIEINFRKSYELTKYRNKISMGFDFTGADKKIVEEILEFSQKKDLDMTKLSPEALSFLKEKGQRNVLDFDEIIDVTKILTGIENDEEVEKLLDAELQETDYDSIIAKLIEKVNLVFTSAKGTSK